MPGNVWAALQTREPELGPDIAPSWQGKHWLLKRDPDGIAWLLLDRSGESTNMLSEAVLSELDDVLDKLEAGPAKGLVLRSAKSSGFAAGGDVREFRGVRDRAAVRERLRRAHDIVGRLDALPVPTVAVIHGYCLGGGLELALACDYRIAIRNATFGFPEVKLGLHPGLGGTARLIALIDPTEAMTMMLTGNTVRARQAKSLGLVDIVTDERHVATAARAAVNGEVQRGARGLKATALSVAPLRRTAVRVMRAKTQKKASREHYPAPHALIDLWERSGDDKDAMLAGEIESFADLLVGDAAQNLIRVFFLREQLKGLAKGEHDFRHVHLVGAGTMGGDIAAWCALKGLRVTIVDQDRNALAGVVKRASELFERELDESAYRRDALDRLVLDFDQVGVRHADVVIEAVPERAEIKNKVYQQIEPQMKEGAILATNTSSIPLQQLREVLMTPERLVGLHFFNPVAKLKLVEVVCHDLASDEALAKARAFCGRIDRLAAPVASAPGFLVNRALTPYLLEALIMTEEGARPETIDRAAESFGMPMGPIEVADRVGLDICVDVADKLKELLDEPMPDVPAWLREKVKKGELGRKSGKGLYNYTDGKPRKRRVPDPDKAMTDRLILPLLNACVTCLRKGVTDDADIVDAALIFATGFAPFRGGPLHYARARGVADVVAGLRKLADEHGPRFAPDEGWSQLDESP